MDQMSNIKPYFEQATKLGLTGNLKCKNLYLAQNFEKYKELDDASEKITHTTNALTFKFILPGFIKSLESIKSIKSDESSRKVQLLKPNPNKKNHFLRLVLLLKNFRLQGNFFFFFR